MLHVICNHVSARIYVSVFRRPGIAIYLKGQSPVCLSARRDPQTNGRLAKETTRLNAVSIEALMRKYTYNTVALSTIKTQRIKEKKKKEGRERRSRKPHPASSQRSKQIEIEWNETRDINRTEKVLWVCSKVRCHWLLFLPFLLLDSITS
jgi:hypothetical protein